MVFLTSLRIVKIFSFSTVYDISEAARIVCILLRSRLTNRFYKVAGFLGELWASEICLGIKVDEPFFLIPDVVSLSSRFCPFHI